MSRVIGTAKGRSRLKLALAAGLGLLLAVAALDRLLPPDTSRYDDSSRLVVDRHGEALRYLPTSQGIWRLQVDPDAVDPQYLALLLAYEDQRFHRHFGIDPLAIGRAAISNLAAGRIVSGASTITMQVARLLHKPRRGWRGKVEQSLRALQLELRYSKRDILSMYLTLAPFGGNIEGVHMASRIFFGKVPASLSLGEAALLIALPQSPTLRRPIDNPQAALAGRAQVLTRLAEAGMIGSAEAAWAKAEPLPRERQALPFNAPHLASAEARRNAAPPIIRTSLEASLQRKLEQLARQEAGWFPDPATIAILVAEIPSRRILAAVGHHDFAGPQGQVDMTMAIRSPGSTLKPFIYAMAFDAGDIHPDTVIDDRPTRFGTYLPRNFDRQFQGRITMRAALQQSLNVPAVAVLERLGPGQFTAALQTLGVTMALHQPNEPPGLAIALGGVGMTLRDLVGLYTSLADNGQYRPLSASDPAIPAAAMATHMFVRPAAARQVGDILANAPRPMGIQGIANNLADRVAYKTGTSYGFRDAWAIGYTDSHVVGIWVGRPDGTPRPGAYGSNTAAPIMFHTFDIIDGRSSDIAPLPDSEPHDTQAPSPRLPPQALRNFQRNGSVIAEGPRILFPPPQVELALPADGNDRVVLEARGKQPLRWYVDGAPLASRSQGNNAEWLPSGPGFFRISVIDAEGRSSSVRTRLVKGDGR
ncbi:penicillin-binding protein 1C [Ferrovibrio sp.]|uniref:penicillin-binding protein 1C n=1 Tax=Ferrovibrio sp. TaxID=1917215 RepID=UPI0025C427C9|nr:penicillin-binding protein 1C [Ferrovibrio sp.]MBX3455260.1 penicillin-binding protein 1C [Ferrovibrio sp.]